MANEAGKGSVRRPTQVSQEEADANWERIFGKKNKENQEQKDNLTKSASNYDMAHSAFGSGRLSV